MGKTQTWKTTTLNAPPRCPPLCPKIQRLLVNENSCKNSHEQRETESANGQYDRGGVQRGVTHIQAHHIF